MTPSRRRDLADPSAAPAPPPRPRRRCATPLLTSLDAEWEHLLGRRCTIQQARGWPDLLDGHHGADALRRVVATARTVDDVVAATHRADHRTGRRGRHGAAPRVPRRTDGAVDGDDVLAALVAAARFDQLAGRLVVQRIVPGVITAARRWVDHDPEPVIDHAISTCWFAIDAFDEVRRRRHIAPALVHDVIWIGFRREARRRSTTEILAGPRAFEDVIAPGPTHDPIVELARVVRDAERAGVESVHLDLVRELAATGSTVEVAARHGVSARTIRNRRHAAERRIAEAVAA